MKWNRWTVALILLMGSCRGISPNFQDKDMLSDKPQPSLRKNRYTFPKELQGIWIYENFKGYDKNFDIDSTWIDQNTFININYSLNTLSSEDQKEAQIWEIKKGTLARVNEKLDTILFENNGMQKYSFDSAGNLIVFKKTIHQLVLHENLFLRKVNKNTFALNYKCPDCNGWKVTLIQPQDLSW
ncbi:hypothetical protein BC751_1013 [Cecembia calidifontis]|jgi:hypothetical protein|uniref:Uncharacterized protein n=2 Tax=Cecembia calidifontis TaxID=1187080 RepID=A0A4Q7P7L5_9BACT|nr:hypothetical protein BC751_1013 [Cecembia calidifontis]